MGGQVRRLAQVGWAHQTAGQGTPIAQPGFVFGVGEGSVLKTEVTEQSIDVAWSTRVPAGFDRTLVQPGAEFTTVATPQIIGAMLGSWMGADTVTGAGPYTHTLSPGTTPWWATLFGFYAGYYYQLTDSWIDELEFSWDRAGALRVKATALSCGLTPLGTTAWLPAAPGVTEAPGYTGANPTNYFTGAGGIFTLGAETQAATRVKSGTVTIRNHVESVPASYQITPATIAAGVLEIATSLVCVPDDDRLWREMLTGTAAGTTIQTGPFLGQFTQKWIGPAITGGTASLQLVQPQSKWAVAFPDVNLEGGAAEYTVEGLMVAPASGNPFTATLVNQVASY